MAETSSVKNNEEKIELPKKSLSVEFFVGLFTILGVLAFGYLAINIARMKFLNTGVYQVLAEFDNVAGLAEGARVEIAGVPVGEVKRIQLDSSSALVTLEIEEGVPIHDDDIAAVRTKGIIGDRYIKIVPGASEKLLESGQKITETESAVELEEVIGKFIHKME